MTNGRKKGLGKGLGALLGSGPTDALDRPPQKNRVVDFEPPPKPQPKIEPVTLSDGSRLVEINPHDIRPNPKQPRHEFAEDALEDLANSIRQDGVQEPVIVRQVKGEYQLVSGERRVRASILAELDVVPAIVREVSDDDMLKLGLIENIQREDLNPIETAMAYQGLIDSFGWTQEELAQQVGKKRATVTNMLRLLHLPDDVQDHVLKGELTMGHARALLAFDSPSKQREACRKIIAQGLSVRQAEKLAAPPAPAAEKGDASSADPHLVDIEASLRRRFGTKVHVRSTGENRGRIEIDYFNLDDLDRILALLRS